ncbi:MAG: glycosyltransferase, partial [Planctomycetes bacterium]|nr:glycosyltransferase [Planctomycetota bacterium]
PDVVLSVSLVGFVGEYGEMVHAGPTGTDPLMGDLQENLLRFLTDPAQNSRFYGLFRTEVIRRCTRNVRSIWAADWVIAARTLAFGKHYEVNRYLFRRGPDGTSSDAPAAIAKVYKSAFFRAMPMLPYTWAVLRDPLIPKSRALCRPLYKWNKCYTDQIFATSKRACFRLLERLQRIFARKRPADPDDAAEIRAIQRLLAEPLMRLWPDCQRYLPPGTAVDCNALLDIPKDADFVDAAHRQIYGREASDLDRAKWLTKLRRVSRATMVAHMGRKGPGESHDVAIPGLPWALLLDQPRHGWRRLKFLDPWLRSVRRRIVSRAARRHQRTTAALQLPGIMNQPADRTTTARVVARAPRELGTAPENDPRSPAPHIALVSPWPPQTAAVADYAHDLAIGLARQGARITVFTETRDPVDPGEGISVLPVSSFGSANLYDSVVYQLSDDPKIHSATLLLLEKFGGIVHLHDLVLQHLIADYTILRGNYRLYQHLLERWYGADGVNTFLQWVAANRRSIWESEIITQIPLFEPAVDMAQACIVHSHFAAEHVNRRLPSIPCRVVPHVYCDDNVLQPPGNRCFRVGVFGDIYPNMHVDKVLAAVARAADRGADIELHVVGGLDRECETLPNLAEKLGAQSRTHWHDRVEPTRVLEILRSVDLCAALWYPTLGKTPAVVWRTLQQGIPTIVSNVGACAELPDVVRKVTTDAVLVQETLCELISRHALDERYHRAARQRAADHARAERQFAPISAQYLRLLEELRVPARPTQTSWLRSA